MAQSIRLVNRTAGLVKKAYYGYSWTTFFWGAFPALFRQDFMTFFVVLGVSIALAIFTLGIGNLIGNIVWGFVYNKYHATKLIQSGYEFDDQPEKIAAAKAAYGML